MLACQTSPGDAVFLPLEQDKFFSGVKSDRFVNLHAMIWRKMSIKKVWSLLSVGVFQSEARRNYFLVARKMEDSYLGMLHNDPYSEYNYYGS